jgi:hypothetical protein
VIGMDCYSDVFFFSADAFKIVRGSISRVCTYKQA